MIFALAVVPNAEASPYWFWSDHPSYDAPVQPAPRRHHPKRQHRHDSQLEKQLEKQSAKPQGPLVVAISIDQQKLRIYDSNGLFAESPVSTGMRGHATPMGVFSVIQKHKYHRSNIYSGAPMPYMQRITWSGVAMHAGVLPGYPASHGCIRMPMTFAMKLWGWTRMGARVIVAPGEVMPTSVSHPLLIAKKPLPEPEPQISSDQPKPVTTPKSDKAAAGSAPAEPVAAADADLRPGIVPDSTAKPTGPVRTADARAGTMTLTDATSARQSATEAAAPAATRDTPSTDAAADAAPSKADAATTSGSGADRAAPAEPADIAASADRHLTDDAPSGATGSLDAGKTEGTAPKDQSRASEAEPPKAALTLPAAKPGGRIAAFVSGKDGKIYVRQNLTPLFDAPVSVAPSDRPLGTHVFTAETDKDNNVRWTVVSLPPSRAAERASEQRKIRSGKNALAENVKASPEPSSPTAALDRLTIPPEAMTRFAEALSSGGSLVVSDQGIAAGETGEGTDFIIRLR